MENVTEQYVNRRQERINKFWQEYISPLHELDKVSGLLQVELMQFGESGSKILSDKVYGDSIAKDLHRQINIFKGGINRSIEEAKRHLQNEAKKEIENVTQANVQSLIASANALRPFYQSSTRILDNTKASYAQSQVTQEIFKNLSETEENILRFIDSHHNYRLLQYHGPVANEVKDVKKYYHLLFLADKKEIKEAINKLQEKGILDELALRDLDSRLKEVYQVLYKDQKQARNNISELLEIIGISEEKTKEFIIESCLVENLEERVNSIGDILLHSAGDLLLQSNPFLLTMQQEDFNRYLSQLQSLSERQGKEFPHKVKENPQQYNTLEALIKINKVEETSSEINLETKPKYDAEIAATILQVLKAKSAINERYIPIARLKNAVYGKITHKADIGLLEDTVSEMVKRRAILEHKSKTEYPLSINPHEETIEDSFLREKVREVLGYNTNKQNKI